MTKSCMIVSVNTGACLGTLPKNFTETTPRTQTVDQDTKPVAKNLERQPLQKQ